MNRGGQAMSLDREDFTPADGDPDSRVSRWQRTEVTATEEFYDPSQGSVAIDVWRSERSSIAFTLSRENAERLARQIAAHLARTSR